MKISEKAAAALQQPDTQSFSIELTPERREKYSRISGEIIDLLKQSTKGPPEAYMLLQLIMQSFEEYYGIRGTVVVENSDERH